MENSGNDFDIEEGKRKFQITRGMVILAVLIILIIAVVVMIVIKKVNDNKPKFTNADFEYLEKRMVDQAPIYVSQKGIVLDTRDFKIDLSNLLEKNGGDIIESEVTKVCKGYVIAKKEDTENYTAYISCGKYYTTKGYVSNDITTTTTTTNTTQKDVIAPSLSLVGEREITIQMGTNYNDPGAKAIDNVDGDITSEIRVSGSVDTSKAGVYEIVYSVQDKAGNKATITRTINVIAAMTTTKPKTTTTKRQTTTTRRNTINNKPTTTTKVTTAPTINLSGSDPFLINVGQNYSDPGFSAFDARENNITGSVRISGNVNTKVAGTYYVTYTVTDSWGNKATKTRKVIVRTVYVPVNSISISPNYIELNAGGTRKLATYIYPSNASNKSVTWSSSNVSVATVSSDGTIRAIRKGTAVITAHAADGKSVNASVIVK